MAEVNSTTSCTKELRDFTQEWDGSDITFLVEDKKLYGNRFILGMWSPMFKAMFSSEFKEKNSEVIPLPGKKFEDILQLLAATHPPIVMVTDKTVENLLHLSREYQMDQVSKYCESFLLTTTPSLRNIILARKYDLTSLEMKCKEYVKTTPWNKIKKEKGFSELKTHPYFEPFITRIDLLEYFVAKLKEIQNISVIKERDCQSCLNSRCVDCGGDGSEGCTHNTFCRMKSNKWPFICMKCSRKRFEKVHNMVVQLNIP